MSNISRYYRQSARGELWQTESKIREPENLAVPLCEAPFPKAIGLLRQSRNDCKCTDTVRYSNSKNVGYSSIASTSTQKKHKNLNYTDIIKVGDRKRLLQKKDSSAKIQLEDMPKIVQEVVCSVLMQRQD